MKASVLSAELTGLLIWLPALLAAAADLGLSILLVALKRLFSRAPRLMPPSAPSPGPADLDALTVVVPAYNEAANIEACLSSLLSSESPCSDWQVLLVDDDSDDDTVALAREASRAWAMSAGRFEVLQAGPRPTQEHWVGKNWACSRAMAMVSSPWVLFLDADVRVEPSALRRALTQAQLDRADLLSLAPRLQCGCMAEWMVQPIMVSLLGLGFPIEAANDPGSTVAFAAGPFMLFRRSAYEAIGGHRAVAAEVVEDLALARRIKAHGFRLRYLLGLDAADLRMYGNFAALWEGWTKNWMLGLDADLLRALGASALVALMFAFPWLLAPATAMALLITATLASGTAASAGVLPLAVALALALIGISLQWVLRQWMWRQFQMPLTHWWLMGAGGLVVGAIGPTSAWRTLTGWGWTWRGRPLG
jgi:hypothetical protein